MNKNAEHSEGWILKELRERQGLVLDDLMAGTRTEWFLSWLHALINARIEDCVVTVITCDQSIDDIAKVDSGIASRLRGFRQIMLRGPDRRAQKHNGNRDKR